MCKKEKLTFIPEILADILVGVSGSAFVVLLGVAGFVAFFVLPALRPLDLLRLRLLLLLLVDFVLLDLDDDLALFRCYKIINTLSI